MRRRKVQRQEQLIRAPHDRKKQRKKQLKREKEKSSSFLRTTRIVQTQHRTQQRTQHRTQQRTREEDKRNGHAQSRRNTRRTPGSRPFDYTRNSLGALASRSFRERPSQDSLHLSHNGTMEFNRMPFGLASAPAILQKDANEIFRQEISKFVGSTSTA